LPDTQVILARRILRRLFLQKRLQRKKIIRRQRPSQYLHRPRPPFIPETPAPFPQISHVNALSSAKTPAQKINIAKENIPTARMRRTRDGKILEQKVVITDGDSRNFADGRKCFFDTGRK
jgi:hypothetical protein